LKHFYQKFSKFQLFCSKLLDVIYGNFEVILPSPATLPTIIRVALSKQLDMATLDMVLNCTKLYCIGFLFFFHFVLILKAIQGYRETERKTWTQRNKGILERVKQVAFPIDGISACTRTCARLNGFRCIKPHIDSVRVSGNTIVLYSLIKKLSNLFFLSHY